MNCLRLFSTLFTLALVSCGPTAIQSKEEARFRIGEQMRTGLLNKEQFAAEMQKVASLDLPEESAKPIDEPKIRRQYEKEASKSVVAPLTRDYNSGAISRDAYRNRLSAMMQVMIAANQRANAAYVPTPNYGASFAGSRYDPNSLANPYGAGSPYKADGLMNPYSRYGSRYSNESWTNPYATNAPKLYDSNGKYLGRLSNNKYDPESTSNPYGQYGNKYSPDSINNPYGAGNPYNPTPVYVVPQE